MKDQETVAKFIELRAKGLSFRTIAQQLNVALGTLVNWSRDHQHLVHNLQAKIVRWNVLDTGTRIDGRDLKTVRPILAEVGVLPRTHGSALFTRGETQALVVATLGTGEDEQYIDSLDGTYKERFLLHYNFPP